MPHIKEATSSSHEKADSSDGFLPLNYQLKTMCLAKKAVQMPNKGELYESHLWGPGLDYVVVRGARLPLVLRPGGPQVGGGDEL